MQIVNATGLVFACLLCYKHSVFVLCRYILYVIHVPMVGKIFRCYLNDQQNINLLVKILFSSKINN